MKMREKRKTITVGLETWKDLTRLKADFATRSLEDVIKKLIENWKKREVGI